MPDASLTYVQRVESGGQRMLTELTKASREMAWASSFKGGAGTRGGPPPRWVGEGSKSGGAQGAAVSRGTAGTER